MKINETKRHKTLNSLLHHVHVHKLEQLIGPCLNNFLLPPSYLERLSSGTFSPGFEAVSCGAAPACRGLCGTWKPFIWACAPPAGHGLGDRTGGLAHGRWAPPALVLEVAACTGSPPPVMVASPTSPFSASFWVSGGHNRHLHAV